MVKGSGFEDEGLGLRVEPYPPSSLVKGLGVGVQESVPLAREVPHLPARPTLNPLPVTLNPELRP